MNKSAPSRVPLSMKTTLLLLGLVCLAGTVHAQRGRNDVRYGPRVIVYENANFKGDELALYPGDEIVDLSKASFRNGATLNDAISSIRVPEGVEVLLFEHHRFEGQVIRTTTDIRNLADRRMAESNASWNDRASSLVVRLTRGGGDRRPVPAPPPPRAERPSRPDAVDPDPIIKRAYQDLLRRDPDPEGLRHFRGLIVEQGWSERMVRDHIRKSDEYRGTGVDRLIQNAYRDVLGRDADPSGLAHYRRKLLNDDWSEQQLRDDLRRSQEYRDRQRRPREAEPAAEEQR